MGRNNSDLGPLGKSGKGRQSNDLCCKVLNPIRYQLVVFLESAATIDDNNIAHQGDIKFNPVFCSVVVVVVVAEPFFMSV